jgi:hypothetical protein
MQHSSEKESPKPINIIEGTTLLWPAKIDWNRRQICQLWEKEHIAAQKQRNVVFCLSQKPCLWLNHPGLSITWIPLHLVFF